MRTVIRHGRMAIVAALAAICLGAGPTRAALRQTARYTAPSAIMANAVVVESGGVFTARVFSSAGAAIGSVIATDGVQTTAGGLLTISTDGTDKVYTIYKW